MAAQTRSLVAFAHVADVERSIRFYADLGFKVGNRVLSDEAQPDGGSTTVWAWLHSEKANLMVGLADKPVGLVHFAVARRGTPRSCSAGSSTPRATRSRSASHAAMRAATTSARCSAVSRAHSHPSIAHASSACSVSSAAIAAMTSRTRAGPAASA